MFYVYVYLDPTKPGRFNYDDLQFEFEPIYIGKGHKNRILDHLKNARKKYKRSHLLSRLRKILNQNIEPIIFKIKNDLTEQEAFALERTIIKKIGRANCMTGPLLNYTDGGDGSSGYKHNPEHISYMKNLHRSNEWRHNIKIALTGVHHTESRKKKNSMSQIGLQAGDKNPRAMRFIFIDEFGTEHIVIGSLKKFCIKNKLRMGTMIRLHQGIIKCYKGWTFKSKTQINQQCS